MRFLAALFVTAGATFAQFKSTVPLVVAPTTITDSKGHYVDGLTAEDHLGAYAPPRLPDKELHPNAPILGS
jgi:hypothetical protein